MKEKKLYECEYCHTTYNDRKKAEECEKNHKKIKGIVNMRYIPIKDNHQGYPTAVYVEFEDGTKAWYKH